jgi:chromosome segregation ATPase
MATTLLRISEDMAALDQLIEERGGDVTGIEEEIAAWFSELGTARDQKIDNYCAFLRELELRISLRKAEAERLQARAKTDANTVEFLKARLKSFLEETNAGKIETERYTVSIAKNGGKLPLILHDPNVRAAELPPAYQRVSVDIDKEAIRADLEAGKVLPFAALGERGTRLSIR